MIKYLANSNIAFRINVNPFLWDWKPFFEYEPPTIIYPKRKTVGFGWFFLQVFIDINDGTFDNTSLQNLMMSQSPWKEDYQDEL